MQNKKVFVLEDDDSIIDVYKQILSGSGFAEVEVEVIKKLNGGVEILKKFNPDLMILDAKLPDGMGSDFLAEARKDKEISAPAIIVSGNLDEKAVRIFRELGALCVVSKPFSNRVLKKVIDAAFIEEEAKIEMSLQEKEEFVYIESCEDGSTRYVSFDPIKDSFKPLEFASLNEKERRRHTICLSSQYGCRMRCRFCATGTRLREGVTNVHWKSMVAKVNTAIMYYGYQQRKKEIIFAGEGEPSLNIKNISKLIEKLGNVFEYRLSTIGLIKTFPRLIDELGKVLKELQISIHFPFDELRKKHMPYTACSPIAKILALAEKYYAETGKKPILNFTLFNEINDSVDTLEGIVELARDRPFIIKISKANPLGLYQRTSEEREKPFHSILHYHGVETRSFVSRGTGSVPCGHMAAKIGA